MIAENYQSMLSQQEELLIISGAEHINIVQKKETSEAIEAWVKRVEC